MSHYIIRENLHTDKKTVVVLGSPSGGTSMISGILRIIGVYMGSDLGHQHEDKTFKLDTPIDKKISKIFLARYFKNFFF